jgi:tetratricopeptide (TPR) repeat protein
VEAERLYRESLAIKQELGDKSGIGASLLSIGILASNRGDLVEAERLFRESLAIDQELGDKSGKGSSLNSLGILAKERGDLVEAERLFRESLAIKQELGNKSGIGVGLHNLGILAETRGALGEAERLYRESLAIHQELGDKSSIAETLHLLIGTALRQPVEDNDVASLCDALLALSEELDTPYLRLWAANTRLLVCVLKPDTTALDDMHTAVGAVRKARAGVASTPDVADGPALALWLAAQSLARAGAADDARGCAEAALREVGSRWWAHRVEAESWLAGEVPSVVTTVEGPSDLDDHAG